MDSSPSRAANSHGDRFGVQPAGGEQQRGCGRVVQPVRVVDDRQHRRVLSGVGEQAERPQESEETIARRPPPRRRRRAGRSPAGAGRCSTRRRNGHSSRCSAAKASGDSDSTPCVRSTCMPSADAPASASSVDFPQPATPARRSLRPTRGARIQHRGHRLALGVPADSTATTVLAPPTPNLAIFPARPGARPGDGGGASTPSTAALQRGGRNARSRGSRGTRHRTGPAAFTVITTAPLHPRTGRTGGGAAQLAEFALMIAAQFMVILDVSVTNVALPSISRGLHLSSAAIPMDHQRVRAAVRRAAAARRPHRRPVRPAQARSSPASGCSRPPRWSAGSPSRHGC